VTFSALPPGPNPFSNFDSDAFGGFQISPPPPKYKIAETRPSSRRACQSLEDKAAFTALPGLSEYPHLPMTRNGSPQNGCGGPDKEDATGWHADWTRRRALGRSGVSGLSLTGTKLSGSPEATGLEVDKLNRAYVKAYFDTFLGSIGYRRPLMGKRGLQYVITDSWEAGVQNWTTT